MPDAATLATVQDGGLTVSSNVMDEAQIRASLAFDPDKPPAADPEPKSEPAPEPTTTPAEGQPEAATAETTQPARGDDGKFVGKPKSDKPKDNPIARMHAATAKEAAAKAEAETLRQRVAELERHLQTGAKPAATPQTPQPPTTRARPTFESYQNNPQQYPDPLDAYMEDLADWKAEQRLMQFQAEREAKDVLKGFADRLQVFAKDTPDVYDKIRAAETAMVQAGFSDGRGGVQWPPAVIEAIVRSERSAEISHYLGSHPEECVQLARDFASAPLTVATGVRRVLEALLIEPPPRADEADTTGTVSPVRSRTAPEPLIPVRPGAGTTTAPGPTLGSAKDHADYYNKLEREARRR